MTKPSKATNRKEFIKTLGLGAIAITAGNMLSSCDKGEDDNNTGEHCGTTDETTAGPYYVPGTPNAVNLNFQGAAGTPMKISGTIYGGDDGETPLANVRVEAWHADDSGQYWPAGNDNYSSYNPAEVNLRGIGFTNSNGQYAFESIRPGLYPGRRRHIHWYIVAQEHEPIFTQSYWADEKGTAIEAQDGTDTNTEDCRYVEFKDDGNGGIVGEFDIYLKKS
ncbi:MAG: hypothetical protein KDC92_13790 [Bacteroidetes bacterium]|nr:hypothetical protein [Bacteroidota bacterium]